MVSSLLSKYKSNLGVFFSGMHFSIAYFVSLHAVMDVVVPSFGLRVILACEDSSHFSCVFY